jgi:hypothetical protein
MILRSLMSTLIAMAAPPALAEQLVYSCNFDVAASEAWVPAQVIVLAQQGAQEALVNDPIINHFLKTPQMARVVADNAKRITFVWSLPAANKATRRLATKFEYRLTYLKTTKQASMIAKPLGYSNIFTAYGSCRVEPVR